MHILKAWWENKAITSKPPCHSRELKIPVTILRQHFAFWKKKSAQNNLLEHVHLPNKRYPCCKLRDFWDQWPSFKALQQAFYEDCMGGSFVKMPSQCHVSPVKTFLQQHHSLIIHSQTGAQLTSCQLLAGAINQCSPGRDVSFPFVYTNVHFLASNWDTSNTQWMQYFPS